MLASISDHPFFLTLYIYIGCKCYKKFLSSHYLPAANISISNGVYKSNMMIIIIQSNAYILHLMLSVFRNTLISLLFSNKTVHLLTAVQQHWLFGRSAGFLVFPNIYVKFDRIRWNDWPQIVAPQLREAVRLRRGVPKF